MNIHAWEKKELYKDFPKNMQVNKKGIFLVFVKNCLLKG